MYEVQFPDRNIGPAFFTLMPDTLMVSKTFITIQGEGPYVGRRAFFIRLAGCNRGSKDEVNGCMFCDADFRIDKAVEKSISELCVEVQSSNCKLVVITGGEPMLQRALPQLIAFLFQNGITVQLESNGDLIHKDWDKPVDITKLTYTPAEMSTLVMSPKVSGNPGTYKTKIEVLVKANFLKVLVDADPASPYHQFPSYMRDFRKGYEHCIYISPITAYKRAVREGEIASIWADDLIDREKTQVNYSYARDICIKEGFRLSLQTHLFTGAE